MAKSKNDGSKAGLLKKTAEALDAGAIGRDQWITAETWQQFKNCDLLIGSADSPNRKLFESYIGEMPYLNFAAEKIFSDACEANISIDEEIFSIKSLPGYEDAEVAAKRIVDEFYSLPNLYEVSIPLGQAMEPLIEVMSGLRLVPDVSFAKIDDAYREMRKMPSGYKNMTLAQAFLQQNYGPSDTGALDLMVKGYIGSFRDYQPLFLALSKFQSIVGIALAYGVIEFSAPHGLWGMQWERKAHIFTCDGSRREYVRSINLSKTHEKMVGHMRVIRHVNGAALERYRESQIKHYGVILSAVLRAPSGESKRLMSAAKWLCESYLAEDQTFAFVQATIALEILVGEEEKKGLTDLSLTALIKNRCAYVLGASHLQRKEIIKEVGSIYSVRSKIVHTGQDRLTSEEKYLLVRLRTYVGMLMQKEVFLIRNATPPPEITT